jgi:RNA polymerase sigma-70 factor (ECF subfamily)
MSEAAVPVRNDMARGPVEALLSDVRAGDRAAFRALYDATSPRLFAAILRMVGRRDVAEDVLQDAYVQIWQRASGYDPTEGPALPWLLAIARYRAIDRLRAGGRLVPVGDAIEEAQGSRPSADDTGTRAAVRMALDALGTDQRRALLLTYELGLTSEELADALGVPLGTAKTWVRRGLAALKARLDV